MDINKILFEQLNLQGVQAPYTADEVNGSDAVQKETVQEENTEIKEEISSALNAEDEDSSLVLDDKSSLSLNKVQKNLSNTQILMNVLSNEAQALENDAEDIEEEIHKKNEEYEQLAQEIEEKQEEYNSLVSKAENSNDESLVNEANELGEEINSLIGKLDSIKTEITNLESDLAAKETSANNFNTTINNLSKVQSTLSQEVAAIQEIETINSVTAADAVQDVSEVSEVNNVKKSEALSKLPADISKWTIEDYGTAAMEKLKELNSVAASAKNDQGYQCMLIASNEATSNIDKYIDLDGDGKVTYKDVLGLIWANAQTHGADFEEKYNTAQQTPTSFGTWEDINKL